MSEKKNEIVPLLGNFFKFSVSSTSDELQKYSVSISPDIPESQSRLRERVLRRATPSLSSVIGNWVFANTALYSVHSSYSAEVHSFSSKFDNQDYTVSITPVGAINSTRESQAFYNKFFNSIQGKLKFIMIGRKFFNPSRQQTIPAHNICVWPGYSSAISEFSDGLYVNIDISHRCLRTISVFEQLQSLRNTRQQSYRQDFEKLVIGTVVLTTYNQRTYHVDEVCWDLSPQQGFTNKEGTHIQFVEYYLNRWNKSISSPDQPLMLCKKKEMDCYLVPELCVMTGLTDEMRGDFNLMRDLMAKTKKEPHERLQESRALVQSLYNTPHIAEEIGQWKVGISKDPVEIPGRHINAGDILMGNSRSFTINEGGSFDREAQTAMYLQAPLNTWGIFFVERDRKLVENMMNTLQLVLKTYQVSHCKPRLFPIQSENWQQWNSALRSNLNPGVDLILCILPGQRGKSRLYDDLKKTTFSELPVPSQVILTGTLKKDKGLRSVLNKVCVQINAKLGGIPWTLNSLPFSSVSAMVVGIDIFSKKNGESVVGMCATVDKHFSRYMSVPMIVPRGEIAVSMLGACFERAMNEFKNVNKTLPEIVIVFRDGVSDAQRSNVKDEEIPQFQSVIRKLEASTRLVYLVVNKRTNARFYMPKNQNVSNPPLGTLVDCVVTGAEGKDFFLMPARANQGAMTPTHFHVVLCDLPSDLDDVKKLAYRLCYSYYNWSGSIRIPAPCQYAHKLAYTYGERAGGPPVPHNSWETRRSLYFL